jgi:flavin-dependent dehydrogenase
LLRRLGVAAAAGSFVIPGMVVTGDRVRIVGAYGAPITGRAIAREHLDYALVQAAAHAGAQVEDGVRVTGVTGEAGRVNGLTIATRSGVSATVRAALVIAADGSYSRIARTLGLARLAPAPRRWAVGAYFTDVEHTNLFGEMHIRRGRYFGVAQLPGGLTNLCVVTAERSLLADAASLLANTIRGEPVLRERFARARRVAPPLVLGPLAVDCSAAGTGGLLLAGDAAGFVDPMTGDGLRFAIRGAELAADEALRTLERGSADAHERLRARRIREFSAKWRFNRLLRHALASPSGVAVADRAASLAPWLFAHAIRYAGDVNRAGLNDEPRAVRKLEERA